MSPVGQRTKTKTRYALGLFNYALGIFVSATAAGLLFAWFGLLIPDLRPTLVGVVIAVAGLGLAARHAGMIHFPLPELRRQTVQQWGGRHGPEWAALPWGLDLGSGLTTFIDYGFYWIIPLGAVLADGLYPALSIFWMFALGRIVAAILGGRALRKASHAFGPLTASIRRRQIGMRNAFAAACACFMIMIALAGFVH